MKECICVSKHAKKRLKERGGIPPSRQHPEARKAYEEGQLPRDAGLPFLRVSSKENVVVRVHRSLVWVFSREKDGRVVLATVTPARVQRFLSKKDACRKIDKQRRQK